VLLLAQLRASVAGRALYFRVWKFSHPIAPLGINETNVPQSLAKLIQLGEFAQTLLDFLGCDPGGARLSHDDPPSPVR